MTPSDISKSLFAVATSLLLFRSSRLTSDATPSITRIFALSPKEGVFAYSRISPSGRFLVYASEGPTRVDSLGHRQIETVVDLQEHKVVLREPGLDAYWSNDETKLIYQSFANPWAPTVTLRDMKSGHVNKNVAPTDLGDYYSWGVRDGRDLILTILGHSYYLAGNRALLPPASIPPCSGMGAGERPLLSKDGRRVTVFVRGTIVVRNLDDCNDIVDTGISGAKADFSWDGRYIAFHTPKRNGDGYEIAIVDLEQRVIRRLTGLTGSSFFPSWTRDGRLSFRYDGPEYHGFLMASHALAAPAEPLPSANSRLSHPATWSRVFPRSSQPTHRWKLVQVWATWSAHSPMALAAAQHEQDLARRSGRDLAVVTATDPASQREDVRRMLNRYDIRLPHIRLSSSGLALTEGTNQMPVVLLFDGDRLVDRRLGAQSSADLDAWLDQHGATCMRAHCREVQ
jgi:hypothetical protein